ncbi:MAG: thymidine kinase [Alphaproteobacteria bacterium]|nr:thymidine kinase [Alphaproteobacteria bacterium]
MAKLHFYYAVMGGGKTTSLLQTEYNYSHQGFKPLIVKPKLDDREGEQNGWGPIQSRILKGEHKALYVDHIDIEELKKIDFNILLVDEVQFFKPADIVALSDVVDKMNIPVICYGLKTACNGELFEGTKKLLAIADDIKEMKHICKCGAKANMHLRYVNGKLDKSENPIAVEKGETTYESVCRKCWKMAMETTR